VQPSGGARRTEGRTRDRSSRWYATALEARDRHLPNHPGGFDERRQARGGDNRAHHLRVPRTICSSRSQGRRARVLPGATSQWRVRTRWDARASCIRQRGSSHRIEKRRRHSARGRASSRLTRLEIFRFALGALRTPARAASACRQCLPGVRRMRHRTSRYLPARASRRRRRSRRRPHTSP
jgi:hypothetical protein